MRKMGGMSEERLTNAVYVEEMQGKMPEQDCKMMGTGRGLHDMCMHYIFNY